MYTHAKVVEKKQALTSVAAGRSGGSEQTLVARTAWHKFTS